MKKFVLRRFAQMIFVWILVSIFSFSIVYFAPGDPLYIYMTPGATGHKMTDEELDRMRESLGLNGNVVEQYMSWAGKAARGNLGISINNKRPVLDQILEKLPCTAGLMGASLVLSLVLAIPLGLIAGTHKNKLADNIISGLTYLGISVPAFWLGIMMIIVFSMTFKLLLTHDGRKMGKTEAGALWLDPKKTSPYDFYQYWRNVDDADVLKCLRMLTFLPLEQINEMDSWEGSQLNKAKEILAFELTSLVHGEEEAKKAEASAKVLFGGGASGEMPTTELSESDLTDGVIDIMSALVLTGLCSSKSEARRNIQQGGVSANDEKVSDISRSFTADELKAGVVLKRGKKNFNKIILK